MSYQNKLVLLSPKNWAEGDSDVQPAALMIKAEKSNQNHPSFCSREYWEERYLKGGTSGYGSYGRLAEFKAKTINNFIENKCIERVIEFGCGDGNQLSLIRVKNYIGVDVSHAAVGKCKNIFKNDLSKLFLSNDKFIESPLKAELALSLDVIFHLIEDDIFENYMNMLFEAAEKYCFIYSCDEDQLAADAAHVRRRKFTKWIADHFKNWKLIQVILNKYPHDGYGNPKDYSFSNFYLYEKCNN